ncbi:hypothetical protein AAF712_000331 [Marasmius tenuissimus]|uniref:FAS1 domain-containing protein n=1 Tax=Marasmius tenuissimus TaxID=585030 RepID=A0ABR3AFQ8_9AGAR|nr:hypothetical protein PM082_001127 [Marasmius tenuissimus]
MRIPFIALSLLPFAAAIFEPIDRQPKPAAARRHQQIPMMEPETTPQINSAGPTLADLLTIDSSTSIFYSYARELELSKLLNEESAGLTLLAPTNKAVMALARKPHQSTETRDETVISEEEFDKMAKRNVERWVSAHIIAEPLEKLEMRSYTTLLEGKSVTFSDSEDTKSESVAWQKVIVEDGIRIKDMKKAANGVIYVIDGTITVE